MRAQLAVVGAMLFCWLIPRAAADCTCHKPARDDKTRFGGNEAVVVVPQKHFREVTGVVEALRENETVKGALAEIFDKPEYLVSQTPWANKPEQHRLRACVTSVDGKFCFKGLPEGAYELRVSLNEGWNVTHVYVVVDRKTGVSKPLHVTMHLGT